MLSPAVPSSSSLRNISTPVTTFFFDGPKPTISISSPTLTLPRSTRPVTTVPRPEIENTSSIGIRKGWSIGRSGRDLAVLLGRLGDQRPGAQVEPRAGRERVQDHVRDLQRPGALRRVRLRVHPRPVEHRDRALAEHLDVPALRDDHRGVLV